MASGILRGGQTRKLDKWSFIYNSIHIPEVVSNLSIGYIWGGKGEKKRIGKCCGK